MFLKFIFECVLPDGPPTRSAATSWRVYLFPEITICGGPPVGREEATSVGFYAGLFGTVLKRLMKPSERVGWVRIRLWTAA